MGFSWRKKEGKRERGERKGEEKGSRRDRMRAVESGREEERGGKRERERGVGQASRQAGTDALLQAPLERTEY